MIPRLGDGNTIQDAKNINDVGLENDSLSRGRKLVTTSISASKKMHSLENDSPSRGRKLFVLPVLDSPKWNCLENDSPSRGRKWKINRQSQQETVNFGINQYCIVLIN